MDVPGSSGGGGGGGDDMDISDWELSFLNEELDAYWAGIMEPMPHQQTIGVEGVVQHQDQLGLVDQQLAGEEREHQQLAGEEREQQLQQLAVEEGEQQLHQQQATGTAEGVLPRGAASPVVASVGFQPGAYAAAAAATGVLHAAAGPSQVAIQREEEQRLTDQQQQQATATEGIQQHPAVPVAQAPSFDQYAATAGVLGTAEEPLFNIPRGPYSFSIVDDLISSNHWRNLENYLRRYMPVHHGHLMHAEVILRCRSEKLLLLLKKQEYAQAQIFLMREITPLRQSISPYVKTEKLYAEIDHISLCVSQNMAFENLETNMKNAINDYMRFYLPKEIGFQQAGVNSTYWRFALRIERSAGVVTARCLLCHCVMKVNSIKQGMAAHIGGQRCQKLTPYALELYESVVVEEEQRKGTKRKLNTVMTSADRGKSAQVDTQVNKRSSGINHLMDINRYLDEVLTSAGEMRVLHQTGTADLNQQVNRIIELVGNIRHSVHHIAGGTGVPQLLPSHTVPGVYINPPKLLPSSEQTREPALGLSIPTSHAPPATGENEASTEDMPPVPAQGDGQAPGNVARHLNTD